VEDSQGERESGVVYAAEQHAMCRVGFIEYKKLRFLGWLELEVYGVEGQRCQIEHEASLVSLAIT
jgi:hypothetical protein